MCSMDGMNRMGNGDGMNGMYNGGGVHHRNGSLNSDNWGVMSNNSRMVRDRVGHNGGGVHHWSVSDHCRGGYESGSGIGASQKGEQSYLKLRKKLIIIMTIIFKKSYQFEHFDGMFLL